MEETVGKIGAAGHAQLSYNLLHFLLYFLLAFAQGKGRKRRGKRRRIILHPALSIYLVLLVSLFRRPPKGEKEEEKKGGKEEKEWIEALSVGVAKAFTIHTFSRTSFLSQRGYQRRKGEREEKKGGNKPPRRSADLCLSVSLSPGWAMQGKEKKKKKKEGEGGV